MELSVIICTYNRDEYLKKTLEALSVQTLDSQKFEIIIVDNNSSDSTKSIVEDYLKNQSNAKYILEVKQGLSYARNAGYKEAKSDNLLYLDDDAYLNPEGLENLVDFVNSDEQLTIVGGRAIIKYPDKKPDWITENIVGWLGAYDHGDRTIEVTPKNMQKKIVTSPIGCCFFVRKRVLDETGGFHPELGRVGNKMLAGEELLISKYVQKNGGKIVYFPKIKVDHAIVPDRINKESLLHRTSVCGISEAHVHFLSEKNLLTHIKYFSFRAIFLLKNIVDYCLALITMNKQKQFEVKMIFNFNKSILLTFIQVIFQGRQVA